MKTLTATPTTAKVDPKYWVINGAPDGATAQNDTTRLSCTAVRTADTNIYQIHVDNVSKLFTALTSLSTNTQAAPYSISLAPTTFGDGSGVPISYAPSYYWYYQIGNYTYTGDPFVYVNDTNGFSAGQQIVVLEGDSQTSSPAFYSEWGTVGSAGQVAITQTLTNYNYTTPSALPLPSSVGNETNQGIFITTSGSTPNATIAGFFPDWTYDYVMQTFPTATTPNIVTFTPATATTNAAFGSWSKGQVVYNALGDYLGVVSTVSTAYVASTTAGIPVTGVYTDIQFYPNSVATTNWANLVSTTSLTSQSGVSVLRSTQGSTGPAPVETGVPAGALMPGNPIYNQYFSTYTTITALDATSNSISGGTGTAGLYYITVATTATISTTATTYIYSPIFGSTVATGVVFGTVASTPVSTTGGWQVLVSNYTVATTGSTAVLSSIVDTTAYRMSNSNLGYGAEMLGEIVSAGTNTFVVPTNAGQPLQYNGSSPVQTLGIGDVFLAINGDNLPSGVITTPGGNQYELDLGPTPPFFTTYDPSPIGKSSVYNSSLFGDTTNGPFASTGENTSWFYPYYKNLIFTGTIANWKSTPVASFVSMTASGASSYTPPSDPYTFSGTITAIPLYYNGHIKGYQYTLTGLNSADTTVLQEMKATGYPVEILVPPVPPGASGQVATNAYVSSVIYSATTGGTVTLNSSGYVFYSTNTALYWNAHIIEPYVVTCDDNSVISSLYNTATAAGQDLYLSFRGEGVYNGEGGTTWQVTGIPTGSTNSFNINATSSSIYANQTNTYPNGDSQNYIYVWEVIQSNVLARSNTNPFYLAWTIPAGSALSTSSYNGSGAGVVTLSQANGNESIGGTHLSGTSVGSYQLGKRWIGSNTTADLESLTVDQIGSRYTSSLFSEVKGGVSTSFIAAPAPAATSVTVTLLANVSSDTSLTTITNGGNITGILPGMLVQGTGIPTGTTVTSISSSPTGSTVYLSNPTTQSGNLQLTFTSTIMNLTADIATDTSVVIVGMGKTQEAVLLSGAHQGIDGTNNNVPIIWDLVKGTTFRFDHYEGEPIFTPNILCHTNPLQNDHGVDTPVIGSPDSSSTTSSTSSTALIAQNI